MHSRGSAVRQCIRPLNVAFITILHISLCLFCSEQTDAQSLSIDQQESTYRELVISVAADLDSPAHAQAVAVIIEQSITSERFDSPIRMAIKQSATIDPFMQSRLRYDVDQNLLLTLDEWSKMLVNPVAADINEDGEIILDEFVDWFARRKSISCDLLGKSRRALRTKDWSGNKCRFKQTSPVGEVAIRNRGLTLWKRVAFIGFCLAGEGSDLFFG